jgi:hypothetical protein
MKTLTLECYLCECEKEEAFRFLNAGDVIVEIKRTDTHCVYSVIEGDYSIDEPPSPGLGDMVAAGLDAVGITKDRVQAIASAVGIKDCGCKQRQQAMNEFGTKFLGLPAGEKPIDSQ